MERRMFLGALGALTIIANAPEVKAGIEAAAKDLDPDEDLTIEDHIRKLKEWADEMEKEGILVKRAFELSPEEHQLNAIWGEAAIDSLTAADIKTLMSAAESGENAGYCPKPDGTWPAVAAANIDGMAIKCLLVEGKVAVDRHGFVVTDAIASPQDRWKLAPIRHAIKLRKADRNHDWLWGMRIAYLDAVPPGVMIMWTNLEVSYDPLTIKDPNAVVIVYI